MTNQADDPFAQPALLTTFDLTIAGRAWQITALRDADAMQRLYHTLARRPHGYLLWESAIVMARQLAQAAAALAGKRVLELGVGVGLPGLVARSLGAQVWQTDLLPGALALAAHNAQQNGIADIAYFQADWLQWSHTARYDLILGAEITYEEALHYYVERILHRNLAPGGTVLLSDPGRPQALNFVTHLEEHGWQVELDTQPIAALMDPTRQIEVAVWRCRRSR